MLRDRQHKIDRSLAIVVEATQNSNRANFPLKSKAKKFDGLTVGFRPSSENFCAHKAARYDALRESSGSEGEYRGVVSDSRGHSSESWAIDSSR